MISKIGFKNIRIFKEMTEFSLDQFTILTGPNNAGKSTLGKMLYLLDKTHRDNDNNSFNGLNFSKEVIDSIGRFNENISYKSDSKQITFKFEDPNSSRSAHDFDSSWQLTYENQSFNPEEDNVKLFGVRLDYEGLNLLDIKKIPSEEAYKYYSVERDKDLNSDFIWVSFHDRSTAENLHQILNQLLSSDEIFASRNEHLVVRREGSIFKSLFGEIVLDNENFFKKSKVSKKAYDKWLQLELSKLGIDNHDQFIQYYIDFEIELIHHLMDIYFGNLNWNYMNPPIKVFKVGKQLIDSMAQALPWEEIFGRSKYNYILQDFTLDTFFKTSKNLLVSLFKKEDFHRTKYPFDAENKFKLSQEEANNLFGNFIKFDKYNPFELIFNNWLYNQRFIKIPEINFFKQNQEIKRDYFHENSPKLIHDSFYKYGCHFIDNKINPGNERFINGWIKRLDLGEKLILKKIESNSRVVGFTYYLKNDKDKKELVDLGLGIRKLIEILLELAMFEPMLKVSGPELEELDPEIQGDLILNAIYEEKFKQEKGESPILVLEEPESNLHPSFQSLLAEILVDAVKYINVRYVIETHSEYFVRKLQYLVSKEKLKKDNISIYYFNSQKFVSKKEPLIKKIEIERDGGLSDTFGPGFFDETTNIQFDLLKANQSQKN